MWLAAEPLLGMVAAARRANKTKKKFVLSFYHSLVLYAMAVVPKLVPDGARHSSTHAHAAKKCSDTDALAEPAEGTRGRGKCRQ
jgi:hypothetical protein